MDDLLRCWFEGVKFCFINVECVIVWIILEMEDIELVQEVWYMLINFIGQVEKFIYIENQFVICEEIVYVINKCMKECFDLYVVIVSFYDLKGLFEFEVYWVS